MFRKTLQWVLLILLIIIGIFLLSNLDKGIEVNDPEHLRIMVRPPAQVKDVLKRFPGFASETASQGQENPLMGEVKIPLGQLEDARLQLLGDPHVEMVSAIPVPPSFNLQLYGTRLKDMFALYLHGDWGYIRYHFNTPHSQNDYRAFPINDRLGEMIRTSLSYLTTGLLLSLVIGYGLAVLAAWKPRLGTVLNSLHKVMIGLPDFFAISLLQLLVATISSALDHPLVLIYQFVNQIPFVIPMIGIALLPTLVLYGTMQLAVEREWEEAYIRTAYSKGLNRTRVLVFHLLRNTTEDLFSVLPRLVSIAVTSMVMAEVMCGITGLGGYAMNDSIEEITSLPATCLILALFVLVANGIISLLRQRLAVSTKEGE